MRQSWRLGVRLDRSVKKIINPPPTPVLHTDRMMHLIRPNLNGLDSERAKGKVLQLAPHLAHTKERLFLLEPCLKSVQYSPHSFKHKTRREGNTSCLLRKFIFKKQTQTDTVQRAGLLHAERCTRAQRERKREKLFL